jgi:hypothetical protein
MGPWEASQAERRIPCCAQDVLYLRPASASNSIEGQKVWYIIELLGEPSGRIEDPGER